MYLISERPNERDFTQISKKQRLKMALINVYLIVFVLCDFNTIKKKPFSLSNLNLNGMYILLGYFFAVQIYSIYMYYTKKTQLQNSPLNNFNQKTGSEISYFATIFWHFTFLVKMIFFGICLSSQNHSFIPTYFLVRFTIYAGTLFLVISQLRVAQHFVLKKDQAKKIYHQHGMWQLCNFHKVLYAGMIGISIDILSFGNSINYYFWIVFLILWILFQSLSIMQKYHGWKFIRQVFQSE